MVSHALWCQHTQWSVRKVEQSNKKVLDKGKVKVVKEIFLKVWPCACIIHYFFQSYVYFSTLAILHFLMWSNVSEQFTWCAYTISLKFFVWIFFILIYCLSVRRDFTDWPCRNGRVYIHGQIKCRSQDESLIG